jgi:hypothetical protein
MNQLKYFFVTAVFACFASTTVLVSAETELEKNFSLLDKWVEVEKTLTKEKYDWDVQKQGLQDVISVYEKELEMLDVKIADAQEFTSAADSKKSGLLEEQEKFREMEASLKLIVAKQEGYLKRLIKVLPTPLKMEISPLVQRIPADQENTTLSLSQRLQSIVGILTQIDKFNTTVEVVPEQREFDSGSLIQVKTIYFGLGAAYYSDSSGVHSGYGRPSASEGWDWVEDSIISEKVLKLIAMYEGGTTEIEFLPLPVKINN